MVLINKSVLFYCNLSIDIIEKIGFHETRYTERRLNICEIIQQISTPFSGERHRESMKTSRRVGFML